MFDKSKKKSLLSPKFLKGLEEYIKKNYIEPSVKDLDENHTESSVNFCDGAPAGPGKKPGAFLKTGSDFRGFGHKATGSMPMLESRSSQDTKPLSLQNTQPLDNSPAEKQAYEDNEAGAVPEKEVVFMSAAMVGRSLEDVVKDLEKSFMELVFTFADQKGISDVEIQKRANIDRRAFSKLKCGTTKNPSKATALALAIALRLNLDDTKDLLSRAGLALSPCSKQDLIVRYFIEREVYDIYEINVALFEHGEQLLGSQNA